MKKSKFRSLSFLLKKWSPATPEASLHAFHSRKQVSNCFWISKRVGTNNSIQIYDLPLYSMLQKSCASGDRMYRNTNLLPEIITGEWTCKTFRTQPLLKNFRLSTDFPTLIPGYIQYPEYYDIIRFFILYPLCQMMTPIPGECLSISKRPLLQIEIKPV